LARNLVFTAASAAALLVAGAAAGEEAAPDDAPADAAPADGATAGDAPSALATYYPPPVGGPELRLAESPTRLYVDGAYAVADDLSALPYIAGRARNFRFAAGGTWRWRRFALEGEVPFVNVTHVDVSSVVNQAPLPEDAHQTTLSLGDLMAGASWTTPLVGAETLVGGFGIRGRFPTHTTEFNFHLMDGSLATFTLPYYFHVEPTLILGGALGRFTFVVNQGAIALLGPDGSLDQQVIHVPTIVFWDAHYAVSWAPWPFLGASVELATDIQINHVSGVDFTKFNDVRAVWVAPALQGHFGDYRVDLIARRGLSRGQELYGVLEYVGTSSYTLRLTRAFN
jgi:hypothetical protein